MKHGSVLLFVPVMALLFSTGCSDRRDQAIADSAASIYEAALAVEHRGIDPALVMPSIRMQAWAIIRATSHTYPPADREFNHKDKP